MAQEKSGLGRDFICAAEIRFVWKFRASFSEFRADLWKSGSIRQKSVEQNSHTDAHTKETFPNLASFLSLLAADGTYLNNKVHADKTNGVRSQCNL